MRISRVGIDKKRTLLSNYTFSTAKLTILAVGLHQHFPHRVELVSDLTAPSRQGITIRSFSTASATEVGFEPT